ncbi:cytochrome P450 [Streptomyces hygroscopicus]|uniref:cytochrome P450 n=1 Tax=Streptomyces hygroscopicus TaxID=1912 RepID=UPI00369C4F36
MPSDVIFDPADPGFFRDRYPTYRRLRDEAPVLWTWTETLRFDAPVHFVWRGLAAPVQVAGERLDAGTHVVLGLAAANRDERRFPAADRLDISRADHRHMAFAAGAHYCPGAPLSRWEGQIFLTRFFARFPDAEVTADEPVRSHDLTFASTEALPLRLGRGA